MRAFVAGLFCVCIGVGAALPPLAHAQSSLPQHTMDWQALAQRIVDQLQLEPGEKVLSVAQPGMFEEFVPYFRYAVMQAGATDMGVIDVLDPPYPIDWDEGVIRDGFAKSRDAYVKMLEDIDAAVMMPGANPTLPAYKALQILLQEKAGPRRTIHFHWTDPYSPSGNVTGLTGVNVLAGFPPPPMQVIDAVYQNAVLNTDLAVLDEHQDRFIAAMRDADVHVTSPAGTDIRFRAEGRDIIQQNGDASAKRMRKGAPFLDREVEIPGGVIRVAPLESTVQGQVVYPYSAWNSHSVTNATITYTDGKITGATADVGAEHLQAELDAAPDSAKYFREFGLGFNPLLSPEVTPGWVGYYGYGKGDVRLGVGNNGELGGAVSGRFFRWRDLLIDCTVTLNGEVWLKDGKFVQ
ncbi:MAG: aminopeptidase [Rhodospirillaceae bacterium]|nr:aminopeptidase [Rhodospirillaceae bacterium]